MKFQVSIATLLFSAIICGCSPIRHAQKNPIDLSGFLQGQMKYEEEDRLADCSSGIKRVNKNIVQFSFFEIFDDSVKLYIGNKEIWIGNLYKKNNPFTSSGWSGFDLCYELKTGKDTAIVELFNQKEYIQFPISTEFPRYMIQRYNGIWYVRALKCNLNLK